LRLTLSAASERVAARGQPNADPRRKFDVQVSNGARRRGSKLYAVGTLKGRLKGRRVTKNNVRIPASLARPASAAQIPPTPNACQILNLTLQPIDLNLLGLRLRTSRIDLRLEGVPGAGNLLGNLLCGITGILDPQAATPATPSVLTQVLNALLALVPRTA
jgi:hypothetical protein